MAIPQTNSKKTSFLAFAIIALLVVGTLGYYLWLQAGTSKGTPPLLNVPKQTLKGQLISGDIICKIPGLYSFSDAEVSNYTKPAGTTDADAKTLSDGIHVYHANQDMTVTAILKSIKPTAGNKVMIAYYPSNGNSSTNFAVYPTDLQGEKKILSPENYKIPANEGFVIFSCQNTTIYKVLDERTDGTGFPTNFNKADSGTHWILFSGWKDGSNASTIKNAIAPYNLKSVWVQTDEGFKFEEVNISNLATNGNYRMIWAEIYANPIKTQTDPQKTICEQNPACTSHSCIPFWGGYTCNMSATSGTSGASGVDSCNTTGGAFNLSGCYAKSGTPYPATAMSSGKTDYCNTTGGSYNFSGCLSQKTASGSAVASGVDVCNTTGGSFNSTGCFVSGGVPFPPLKSSNTPPFGIGLENYFPVNSCATQCNYSNYTCKQPPASEQYYCLKNGTSLPASITTPVSNAELKITKTTIGSPTTINGKNYVEISFDFSLTGTLSPFDKVVWDFGDGSTGGLQGFKGKDWFYGNEILPTNKTSHNYTKSGDYTVTVKALSSDGKLITSASTSLPFSMPNFSPVKITKCYYDSYSNSSGYITWTTTTNSSYSYQLNYTTDSNVKKTITVYPTTDTTHKVSDNDYAPFAKMTDTHDADIYNLNYGGDVKSVSLTPTDSNGKVLDESDACLLQ